MLCCSSFAQRCLVSRVVRAFFVKLFCVIMELIPHCDLRVVGVLVITFLSLTVPALFIEFLLFLRLRLERMSFSFDSLQVFGGGAFTG